MTPAKLAKGIYRRGGVYWLNFQERGKRRFVSLETCDPMEAMGRAAAIRAFQFPDRPTAFSAVAAEYLADKARLNLFTAPTARINAAILTEFGERVGGRAPLACLKTDAEAHYRALQSRVAETTAQIHFRALRAFFNWAIRQGLARLNPFSGLELAKIDQKARQRFCTKAQRDLLIEKAPTDDLTFILLAGFDAGMRKNEIVEARASWFDVPGLAIHPQNTATFRLKDNEARAVPLTQRFAEFLRRYLSDREPDDFALRPEVSHGHGTYRYDFHRPYNDYMTASGMRWVTAHVMRHTFASLLVQSSVSIYKVARWLGDGVKVVEDHYGHLAPKDADIERLR